MKKIINKIKESKLLSNMSWIIFGRIIYMSLNFIVGLLSARFLGPSNYGIIGYAAAFTTFFNSICTLGINSVIIKEFVDNPQKEGEILGTSIVLRFISSTFSLIIINIICLIADYNESLTKIVVFLYSISIIFQIFEIFKYWFQYRLQSKYSEISKTIAYIVMAIYKIYLLISNKSVKWFALSNTIEYIVIAVLLFYLYKKNKGSKLSFSKKYAKQLLKKSYHFIITGLMIALYNSTDKFMLKQMLDENSVAYYTTAITLSNLITFVLAAIIESYTPVILENYNTNKEIFKRKNEKLYSLVFYVAFIASLFISIFSPLIIKMLYGNAYLNSINPLRILSWYVAFSYLGCARDIWIVAEKKQKYLKYIYISCAFINVIFNYLLIPKFGASGAAFASLITQISTVLIIPLFIKPLKENVTLMINGLTFKYLRLK